MELTIHIQERMSDRGFTEVDLRTMLEAADRLERGIEPGSWEVSGRHGGRRWAIIVVPDFQRRRIIAVTAYQLD